MNVKNEVKDVADDETYKERFRLLIEEREEDNKIVKYIIKKFGSNEKQNIMLADWLSSNKHLHTTIFHINEESTEFLEKNIKTPTREIHYYTQKSDRQSSSNSKKELNEHLVETEKIAKCVTNGFDLPENIKSAVITAAKLHDVGKKELHWQKCMHVSGNISLAKTGHNRKPLPMGGFRHEFASLIHLKSDERVLKHKEKDLIMHLIASHHGWARPCFKPGASNGMKPQLYDSVFFDTMQRYSDLQKRFGVWGLAWLEGLVRSSDWRASSL